MIWTDPNLSDLDVLATEDMADDLRVDPTSDKLGRKHFRKYAEGAKCECGRQIKVGGMCRICYAREKRRTPK